MGKKLPEYIVIVGIFFSLAFLGRPVFAASPCSSISVTPNPSTGVYSTNQVFTLNASGCPANYTLNIVGGPQNADTTFGFTVQTNANGSFTQQLQNFATQIGSYEIFIFNSATQDRSDAVVITFNKTATVSCGDIVAPNSTACPSNCPSVVSESNSSVWVCPTPRPASTPVPVPRCSLAAKVSNINNQFALGVSINQEQLPPGNYRLVLNNNAGPFTPKTPFSVSAGQASQQLGFNLDNGYAGNTYTLFVETNCINPAAGGCPHIDGCSTDVTFPGILPSPAPSDNPLPSVPPKPGSGYQIATCTPTGGQADSGIQTAVGCISGSADTLFMTIFQLLFGIAGGITFLLIIIGGIQILFSQGNPERLGAGREIITSAIVGLFLIVFSVFLLKVVGVDILAIPGFG